MTDRIKVLVAENKRLRMALEEITDMRRSAQSCRNIAYDALKHGKSIRQNVEDAIQRAWIREAGGYSYSQIAEIMDVRRKK